MLRSWAHKAATELEHKLAMGRLLAGARGRSRRKGCLGGADVHAEQLCWAAPRLRRPLTPPRLSLPPGEDLQAVEPLRVMELLNRRASSALGEIDEAAASGDGQIAAGIGRA